MRWPLRLGGGLQPRGGVLALQACLPDILPIRLTEPKASLVCSSPIYRGSVVSRNREELLCRDVGHCALKGLPRLLKLSHYHEDIPHVLVQQCCFLPLLLLQNAPS